MRLAVVQVQRIISLVNLDMRLAAVVQRTIISRDVLGLSSR